MRSEEEIISEAVDEYLHEEIKLFYAKQAGLDAKDPEFWKKLSKHMAEIVPDEHQAEYCPCCGQLLEDED